MLTNKPKTKILVDGGDPEDTSRVRKLVGFVDGQTTNPSLIAKNPDIQRRIASGHTLSPQEEKDEYRKIVQAISPLVGDAGVSIEVFADIDTTAEDMLAQGEEMFSWIPNTSEPIVPEVSTVVAGLLPIMWSTRTGAEVMKPLATPVLGGMVSSLLHVLIVTPVIVTWLRERDLSRKETAPAA